jgi:hypothetical protein
MSPQTQSVTLDGVQLKKVAHASHTAEVTITALAIRERLRPFSDITRTKNQLVRNGEKIVEADYMNFWKGLQDAGVGVIVYGRKGKPDRFEWHYSMKKVAKAALDGTNEAVEKLQIPAKEKPAQDKVVRKEKSETRSTPKVHIHNRMVFIPLRKDFCLEFSVPSDLSRDEIQVIENALRRLSA